MAVNERVIGGFIGARVDVIAVATATRSVTANTLSTISRGRRERFVGAGMPTLASLGLALCLSSFSEICSS